VTRLHLALLCAITIACSPKKPEDVTASMVSCVPPSTSLLAGIDLDRVRSSPLYPKLPPAVTAIVEPYREAHSLLLASNGRNFMIIARGPFQHPPAGATVVNRDLAVAGDPEFVSAALAQQKTGKSGAPDLVADAATISQGNQIWVVARGGVALPLTGNAANLSRLLRNSEFGAVSLRLEDRVILAATVLGRTPDAARQVEETLRAAITLAAAGESRQTDLQTLLKSIQLVREDRIVKATVNATPEVLTKLF
jgi:hypothetical protein